MSERPSDIFMRWALEGRLAKVLPDLDALRNVSQLPGHRDNAFIHTLKVVDAIEPTPVRRWAAMLHDIGKGPTYISAPDGRSRFFEHDRFGADMAPEIMQSAGESGSIVSDVTCLVQLHMRPISYLSDWTDSAVRRLYEEATESRGNMGWEDLLALARADLRGYLPEPIDRGLWVVQSLEERWEAIKRADAAAERQRREEPQSPLDGTEILALAGGEQGPWIGHLKNYLREEVAAGRLAQGDKPGAGQLALSWLAANSPRNDDGAASVSNHAVDEKN